MHRMLFAVLFALALAACAAPATTPPQQADPPQPGTAPAASDPATRVKSGSVVLDLSCRTATDCAVKDVGNCCGHYPMCVNKDSPADPAGVMAQCQASGRMSVCGFREISACQCIEGRCAAQDSPMRLSLPADPEAQQ